MSLWHNYSGIFQNFVMESVYHNYENQYNFKPSLLTKCVLGATFAGLLAVAASESFNLLYRIFTGYFPSDYFNVSTLIFGTMILFLVAGMVFFFLAKFVPGAVSIVYPLVMLVATVFLFIGALSLHRFAQPEMTAQFRFLTAGMVLIMGVMVAFLVPYFSRHYKTWF